MLVLAAAVLGATMQSVPFTLERLELDLKVNYQAERIDGTARLTVRNSSAEPADTIPLLLGRLMTVANAGEARFEQDVVTFGDESKRQVDAINVHLPKPLAPNAATTVSIAYGGHIVGYTETGNLYVKDRIADDYSIIREDAFAFPALGVPMRSINRKIPRGDFTFDAKITVPRGQIVACGALVERVDAEGGVTFHFASEQPVPFLNISIAPFRTLEEGGVTVYYLPADEAGAKVVLQKTQATLELFANWFGPLGRAPRITIIEIPNGWGSQADLVAGMILAASSFQDSKRLFELYHEIAHLWNPRDLDNPSPRLNEGLSMWLQWVVAQKLDGLQPEQMAKIRSSTIDRVLKNERLRSVPLMSYGSSDLTDASYSVGQLYFAELDEGIGRDALLQTLRQFYQANKEKGATLRDFMDVLEERAPQAKAIDRDWITSTKWFEKLKPPS